MISNSRNKLHQTTYKDFFSALYISLDTDTELPFQSFVVMAEVYINNTNDLNLGAVGVMFVQAVSLLFTLSSYLVIWRDFGRLWLVNRLSTCMETIRG